MRSPLEAVEYQFGDRRIVPFDVTADYFRQRVWFDSERLSDMAELVPGSTGRLLEMGAAPYILTAELVARGFDVTVNGLPFDELERGIARLTIDGTLHDLQLDLFDAELGMPYEDSSFDVIVAGELLEHLYRQPWVFLQECWRCLVPGGLLVLTTPNGQSLDQLRSWIRRGATGMGFNADAPSARHAREYSAGELRELLSSQGFTADVRTRHYTHVTDWPGLLGPLKRLAWRALTHRSVTRSGPLRDRGNNLVASARRNGPPGAVPAFMVAQTGDPRSGNNFDGEVSKDL